ncbi:hypothetical protein [Gandjariella thermophila]|uniref:Uncharacterized protein n=1 Tax=Gandjariella thermophila TaxID=1931992 RepID=A0A4D4JDA4_9PSEU|nr:hypothetical protein [Gandjariella thermophila]GDY33614.1 hypothetical protein GTS_52470 [Gandjariella thermophila]
MTADQPPTPVPGPADPEAVPRPGPPPDPTARIDDAVAGLEELAELPVAEHVARFDAVHAALAQALSTIDQV